MLTIAEIVPAMASRPSVDASMFGGRLSAKFASSDKGVIREVKGLS